jgi:hypothetical protein
MNLVPQNEAQPQFERFVRIYQNILLPVFPPYLFAKIDHRSCIDSSCWSSLPICQSPGWFLVKSAKNIQKFFSHETQRLPATNSRNFRGRLFSKAPGCDARSGTSRCRSNISKDLPAAAERWGFSGWGIEPTTAVLAAVSMVIYLYYLVIFHIPMEIHYKWRF